MSLPLATPTVLDELDKKILGIVQTDFPVSPHPYATLGERLQIPEEEALTRVKRLKECGIIRRLGANFDSRKMGWRSTLCAAKVPPAKLDTFISAVNALPGVTHNYLRSHTYNVWFTLIAPSPQAIENSLAELSQQTGIAILNLPAEKIYKIKVNFALE